MSGLHYTPEELISHLYWLTRGSSGADFSGPLRTLEKTRAQDGPLGMTTDYGTWC
jgi:hypothetical protein